MACLLDWMRLASSKAYGLENEHVPCSAGETPAIQFPPQIRNPLDKSAEMACLLDWMRLASSKA